MHPSAWIDQLQSGGCDKALAYLYGDEEAVLARQRARYIDAITQFQSLYPQREQVSIFSAPGRTEVGGNHTDHQHGCVLAAAVNLDVIAIVAFHQDGVIRLQSKGHAANLVELDQLEVQNGETGSSTALIRGIAAKFTEMGAKIGGFDAYTTSDVLGGSGLSSSAAFEVLVGTILDHQYNQCKAGAVEIAKIGQYAENQYFGKGSGLMDQMVSSVGGFVFIDFADTENPIIEKHEFDFQKAGYCLCVTDTKGSHADLTEDYVSVPSEMKQVASHFNKTYLREVEPEAFYQAVPELRKTCSDRAILRAAHFFAENQRAKLETQALEKQNLEAFFQLVTESGESSANLLQNLYSCKKPGEQGISLAIFMSKRILKNKGAVRVHGGGFAGTIQAFVPADCAEAYAAEMNRLFGEGSCYVLRIRPVGGVHFDAFITE